MARLRADLETAWTALGAAFAFVPFLPRLAAAVFTAGRSREEMRRALRDGAASAVAEPPAPPPSARPLRIVLVAGEPSGDLHASNLARALLAERPDAVLEGVGGPRMAAAGVRVSCDLVSDPVMGVWPVVRRAPAFFRLYRDLLGRLDRDPPEVVVGIDYPGLNLRLAAACRRRGVPFVLYVAPQVWAWAPWRTRQLARRVSRVLPILPFEQPIFERAGAAASYVGHPLFEHLAARGTDAAYRASLREGLGPDGALVALLPGSRRSEVRTNLPLLADAARRAAAAHRGLRFVVPLASERLRWAVSAEELLGAGLELAVAPPERSDDAMAAADAAISVSGTATLHLAHHGVPAVVVYRASAAGRALARLLVVSPWIALPNLVAGADVLPEFVASADDGQQVASALVDLLPGGTRRAAALEGLRVVRERLSTPGTATRAARWVLAEASRAG